ncbi:AfsR/SARP family transcriptional regulator [Streptomyces sp. L7]
MGRGTAGDRRQTGAELRGQAETGPARTGRRRGDRDPARRIPPPAGRGELDLHRFQALVDLGRGQAAEGRYRAAGDTLDQALGLWRGPALGGAVSVALRAEAARLEEMRLAAVEAMIGARLESGGGAEGLVGELTRLVSEHPLREQLRTLQMTALWRCGRRADALKAYRDGDRLLRSELGIGPGPELRALHSRLLASDRPHPEPVGVSWSTWTVPPAANRSRPLLRGARPAAPGDGRRGRPRAHALPGHIPGNGAALRRRDARRDQRGT